MVKSPQKPAEMPHIPNNVRQLSKKSEWDKIRRCWKMLEDVGRCLKYATFLTNLVNFWDLSGPLESTPLGRPRHPDLGSSNHWDDLSSDQMADMSWSQKLVCSSSMLLFHPWPKHVESLRKLRHEKNCTFSVFFSITSLSRWPSDWLQNGTHWAEHQPEQILLGTSQFELPPSVPRHAPPCPASRSDTLCWDQKTSVSRDALQTGRGLGLGPWNQKGDHLGLSENSVPLNPMVNDHYPY